MQKSARMHDTECLNVTVLDWGLGLGAGLRVGGGSGLEVELGLAKGQGGAGKVSRWRGHRDCRVSGC